VKDEALIIVDVLSGEKTKDITAKLKKLGIENALVIGGAKLDEKFAKAARNIPNIDVLPLAGLNVYDVMRRKTLVLTREAVEGVNARLAPAQAEAEKA
jgi:large subunit ribosomal protein L4